MSEAAIHPANPGPVASTEHLARLYFEGDANVSEDRLQPEGISRQDLGNRGWSVQRRLYLTADIVQHLAATRGRAVSGFFSITCADVLAVLDPAGVPALNVDPHVTCELERSHAVILVKKRYKPSELSMLRDELLKTLSPRSRESPLLSQGCTSSVDWTAQPRWFSRLLAAVWAFLRSLLARE